MAFEATAGLSLIDATKISRNTDNPDNPDLLLEQAILLALTDNMPAAEQTLKQIESRWPEWDRAYLVHGLLFEQVKRTGAARQKLQTAIALGSGDLAARCALARLGGHPSPSQARRPTF